MGQVILFDINWTKAIEAVAWLAARRPGIDVYQTGRNEPVDYAKFVSPDNPCRDEILAELRDAAHTVI